MHIKHFPTPRTAVKDGTLERELGRERWAQGPFSSVIRSGIRMHNWYLLVVYAQQVAANFDPKHTGAGAVTYFVAVMGLVSQLRRGSVPLSFPAKVALSPSIHPSLALALALARSRPLALSLARALSLSLRLLACSLACSLALALALLSLSLSLSPQMQERVYLRECERV